MLPATLTLLALYALSVLWVAKRFERASDANTLDGFFLANKQLGHWPVALTLVATWFGGTSTIGSLQAFYTHGVSAFWKLIFPSIGCWLIVIFCFARQMALQPGRSMPEALSGTYGPTARTLLAITITASTTALMASQLVASHQVLAGLLGGALDPIITMGLVAGMVVVYTALGGYKAVVMTDILQVGFIILGLLVLLGAFFPPFTQLGWQGFWANVSQARPDSFWHLMDNPGKQIVLMLTFVMAWSIAPELWQRLTSLNLKAGEQFAKKSCWLALLILTALYALVSLIGLAAPGILPPVAEAPGAVMLALMQSLHNPWLGALVLTGFIAAISSTIDSTLNVGSLTLVNDVLIPLRPSLAQQPATIVRLCKLSTLVMALPALWIAVQHQDIINALWISADIYACAMFVPVVALLYSNARFTPTASAGVWAMATGLGWITLNTLMQSRHWLPHWPEAPYSTLYGVSLSLLAFYAGQVYSRKVVAN
ncbi:MAG: sodium:solute symporter family protein [Vampirovibrionales bacterium]|nr:sodium:solute symporter family protein [Vampirovibrionales bacterium]